MSFKSTVLDRKLLVFRYLRDIYECIYVQNFIIISQNAASIQEAVLFFKIVISVPNQLTFFV